MNPASTDIKDILEADSNLDLEFQRNLFISREPTSPDDCVTIFDTTGRAPHLAYNKEERYEYPAVQIRVRGRNYLDTWALIKNIELLLHGQANIICNGTLYTVIYCSSGPALLDWDNNNRVRLIINFEMQRR